MSGIALALSLCLREAVPLTDSLKQAGRKLPAEEEEGPLIQASFVISHGTPSSMRQYDWEESLRWRPACIVQETVHTCYGVGHLQRLPGLRRASCMAAGRGERRSRGLPGEEACTIW